MRAGSAFNNTLSVMTEINALEMPKAAGPGAQTAEVTRAYLGAWETLGFSLTFCDAPTCFDGTPTTKEGVIELVGEDGLANVLLRRGAQPGVPDA